MERFVESEDKSDDEKLNDSDDLSGIEPFEEEMENSNHNARVCQSPREEGEASSDSEADLRKVIKAKQRAKGSGSGKGVQKESPMPFNDGPSTSRGGMVERSQADNANFENFMIWMDRYKQFQEWESQQPDRNTQGAKVDIGNPKMDKAIQSPSESTVYTRMCKSVETGINFSQNLSSLDSGGVIENGRMIVDNLECSSTASTIDNYAHLDTNQIDSLILEARKEAERGHLKRQAPEPKDDDRMPPSKRNKTENRRQRSSHYTSGSDEETEEDVRKLQAERDSKERRDKILLDAELHRAELLKPGTCTQANLSHLVFDAQHRSLGSHIDKAMEMKIVRGEYVELHELLPRRRLGRSRFSKPAMKLINDNGVQKWVEEQDDQLINSYRKWEEPFEIYASIYVRGNPGRADELYDYKYTIRDAANTYIWDNVYDYDIEFRLHMEKCKNNCRWSAKLDYEWSKCLKNHISFRHDQGGHSHFPGDVGVKSREICNRYNKGR